MNTAPKKNFLPLLLIPGIVFVIWLAYRYIAPFGKVVTYQFSQKLPGAQVVTNLPAGNQNSLNIPSQIIKTDQVRFAVNLLSPDIDSIKATLRFKEGPGEILLGVRGNEKDPFYYKSLYYAPLQKNNWSLLEEGSISLLQKEKKYKSIRDFINAPSMDQRTLSYSIHKTDIQPLWQVGTQGGKALTEVPIRGNITLSVGVDKAPLILKISKQDINAYNGEDKYRVAVYSEKNLIAEKVLPDDGITDDSLLKTRPQEFEISAPDVKPGIYRIEVAYEGTGLDSTIVRFEINQRRAVFSKSFTILGNKPTQIWTDSSKISVATAHKESFQTVVLDDQKKLDINEKDKKFSFDLASLISSQAGSLIHKLETPKNDLTIEGDGYFAFSRDAFFKPEMFESSDRESPENLTSYQYVLTTYHPAILSGSWLSAQIIFDPKDIKLDKENKIYFTLDIPDIRKRSTELEIDSLDIQVKGKGVLESVVPSQGKQPPLKIALPDLGKLVNQIINKFKSIFPPAKLKSQPPVKQEIAPKISTPSSRPVENKTTEIISIPLRILNGGAGPGAAAKWSGTFKEAGFTRVEIYNADNANYRNAVVRYGTQGEQYVDRVINILKNEYAIIDKISTSSSDITVVIGTK